jgi:flagellar FliL protein
MTDEAAGDGAASKTKTKSKLPLVALVGVVVLVGAGVGGAWALGLFGADAPRAQGGAASADGAAASEPAAGGDGADEGAVAPAADPIFVDLPQLLVNLVSDDGGTRFLKLSLAVEVGDEGTAERIDQLAPRIVDSFQLYLRTLTAAELRGPGSMFRLKEDLHVRIHRAIAPAEVRDVLFKEMLVQ